MYKLNLPPYAYKLSGTKDSPKIWDVLRGRYVALTPEEWVRQHFIAYLLRVKGYPQQLLANEVNFKIGKKPLRADSVLYDRTLRPRMIIEYKAPYIALTEKVIDQICTYDIHFKVDYLVISNGMEHYCFKRDEEQGRLVLCATLPDYQDL